jgi:hypothetical protein
VVEVLVVGSGVLHFGLTLNCADHRLGFQLVSIVTIERRVLCSSSHYYLLLRFSPMLSLSPFLNFMTKL